MGDFRWEVKIGNEIVAEIIFCVEDLGPGALSGQEYIAIDVIKLFESDAEIKNEAGRKYYNRFKKDEIRYVCAEIKSRKSAIPVLKPVLPL
ncbi:MAG: hypothetical protein QM687_08170 [Ferruginibacter sp.]